MTKRERREPVIIDGSRRTRIARGRARSVSAVNQLLKQFNEMRKMMRQMGSGTMPQCPAEWGEWRDMAAKQAARSDAVPARIRGAGRRHGERPAGSRRRGKTRRRRAGGLPPPNNAKL